MKTSQELLSSVLKTTQMGQVGIRSVLDTTLNPELRQALVQQLKGRERQVVLLRYGLGGEPQTQQQTAAQLHISRSYV